MEAENARTEHSIWEEGEVPMREDSLYGGYKFDLVLEGNLIEILLERKGDPS